MRTPTSLLACTALIISMLTCAAAYGVMFDPQPARVFANGRIYDISHQIREGLPQYDNINMTGKYVHVDVGFNDPGFVKGGTQEMSFGAGAHTSTHVDAPSHAIPQWQSEGYDVDSLDLDTLNGPALLIDVPRDQNITADCLRSLNISKGVKRVLFRTLNTDRNLMWRPWASNYTGITYDGAQYLVNNTDIKLVGIDYMSIAIGDKANIYGPIHQVLLANRDIIPVEGLNLQGVPAGAYNIICLPLRIKEADGSPARCILIK